MIPYGRHSISEDDIDEVCKVLRTDNITQGPTIPRFEKELANCCDAKFAVAVNSGTSALHIACLALGIKPGVEVITSSITFVASSNCVIFCGATPIFADIDPKTYNITPLEIEKKITEQTKLVIAVHFAGQSCDMEGIASVVATAEGKYGTKINIIEDGSHALGSYYKRSKVGSCKYSQISMTSFHPVKHITTGEGGIAFTNDEGLYNHMIRSHSHGITVDRKIMKEDLGPWYYEQIQLGYNYRITDLQCALGLSQLKKLDLFKKKRRDIVNRYNQAFRDLPYLTVPYESETCNSNFHLYVILFDFKKMGITRNEFKENLELQMVSSQIHYIPVHLQPYYQENYGTSWGDLPHAENYFQQCLSIPLYPSMTEDDVMTVIRVIKAACLGKQ